VATTSRTRGLVRTPTLAAVRTARSERLLEAPTLAVTSASGSGSSPKSSKALTSRTFCGRLAIGALRAGNSLKFHCPGSLSRHLTPAFRHQPFHPQTQRQRSPILKMRAFAQLGVPLQGPGCPGRQTWISVDIPPWRWQIGYVYAIPKLRYSLCV